MPTVIVRNSTGNNAYAGYPAANKVLNVVGTVSAETPETITGDEGDFDGCEVGDFVKWTVSGVTQIRQVVDVDGNGEYISCHTSVTVGTGTSTVGGAVATIQEGLNIVTALTATLLNGPYTVSVAEGTYNETATIGVVGTSTLINRLVGVGTVIIDGQNTRATGVTTSLAAGTNMYWDIENIKTCNCTTFGFEFQASAGNGQNNLKYSDCEAYANASGFHGGSNNRFIRCFAHDNTSYGFSVVGDSVLVCCRSYNHNLDDYYLGYRGYAIRCIGKLKADKNTYVFRGGNNSLYEHCVAIGNGTANYGTGISCTGTTGSSIVNCIIVDIGTGISADAFNNRLVENNLMYNNTANYSFTIPSGQTHTGLVADDPLFVDAANLDFRLKPNSPARRAGTNNSDIGAYQTLASDLPRLRYY